MTRKILSLLAVFMIVLFTGCSHETYDNYGDLTFEWENAEVVSSTQVIYPGMTKTYTFKADNLKDVSWTDVPSGWTTGFDKEKNEIVVTANGSAENNRKVFKLKMVIEGMAGDVINQELSLYFVDLGVNQFDDPAGTFVLNEGNMTTENGSLSYITPEGYMLEDIYKQINGTELGNVCQDMCFHDGKIYIISQNGDENPVGTEFENDGMLVILDARTLKKIDSYTKEDLNMLSWPSHIAVLDDNHVYIRDNGVKEGDNGSGKIWKLNTSDRSVTEIVGTTGVPKSPLYKRGDKLYTYVYEVKELFGMKFCYFKIIEIQSSSDEAVEYKTTISKFVPVNVIPANEDNVFWVLLKDENEEYYSIGKTKLLSYGLEQVKSASIDDAPNNGASGVRFVSTDDNTFYYTSSTYVIKGSYSEESATGTPDGKKITVETEVLADLMELDQDAREVYNGLGIHPVTGHLYINTIKGMGNMYTTNQIWEFNLNGSMTEPVNKWSNYTKFPAGFFFPGENK